MHKNTGKENRYRICIYILLYLSVHRGDFIEHVKKYVIYTLTSRSWPYIWQKWHQANGSSVIIQITATSLISERFSCLMHGVSRTYWSRFLHKVYQLARCSTKHNRFEKIAFICMKINMKNKGFFRHETFVSTLHVETKQKIAQKRSNKRTKQSPFKLGQCLDMIASLN